MNPYEEAAISYQPDDQSPKVKAALAEAERQLSYLENVAGFGMSQTFEGEEAVIVFVKTEETLALLPTQILGIPLLGEVTGEIGAL